MDWSRIGRIWAFPRRNASARSRWEYIGRDTADAYRMMDGSDGEEELRLRGGHMARHFVGSLDVGPQTRVLEVGCGVARVGRELAPLCGHYTGADISASLLRHARRRTSHLGNVQLVHLQGPALAELAAGHHDRLICHLVFLHLDEPEIRSLLRGFARTLAPDGIAYFDAWNLRHPDVWDLFRRESFDANMRRQPHRSRFYTREAVDDWIDAAGLQPLWVRDSGFLVQAVTGRRDGDTSALLDLADHLASNGDGLIPTGRLEFETDAEASPPERDDA